MAARAVSAGEGYGWPESIPHGRGRLELLKLTIALLEFTPQRTMHCEQLSMVAPSAPRDARSKTPPGPEGSNGID